MSFQSSNGRCVIATYDAIDATTISVNNSEVSTNRFGVTQRSVLLGKDRLENDRAWQTFS